MPALYSEMTMTELVERLRKDAHMNCEMPAISHLQKTGALEREAAAEIERLTTALSEEKSRADKLDAEVEQLSQDRYAEQVRADGLVGWRLIGWEHGHQVGLEEAGARIATGTLPPDMVLMPRTPTVGMLNALFGGELNERGLAEYRSRWLDLLTEIDSTHAVNHSPE